MSRQKLIDPLTEARRKLASYAGILARWGDLTGNVPPHDVDREQWRFDKFAKWLEANFTKENAKRSASKTAPMSTFNPAGN